MVENGPLRVLQFVKSSFIYHCDVVSITKLNLSQTFFYVVENKNSFEETEKSIHRLNCGIAREEFEMNWFLLQFIYWPCMMINEKAIDILQLFYVSNLRIEFILTVFYTHFILQIICTCFIQLLWFEFNWKVFSPINVFITFTVFPIHGGTPSYIRYKCVVFWYSRMHSEKCGQDERHAGKWT